MKKVKGVIFDVDGVILNSEDLHIQAFQKAFSEYGVDFSEEDHERYFAGMTSRDGIVRFNQEKNLKIDRDEFAEKKLEKTKEIFSSGVPLYSDTLEFIKKIHRGNLEIEGIGVIEENPQLAIGTGLRRDILEKVLAENDFLRELFPITVTADDYERGKPDPEGYFFCLEKMKLPAGEVFGIEDSPVGVQALESAGIFSVGITNTHTKEELKNADLITESLEKLIKIKE